MFTSTFQQLGFSKNEAILYETLIRYGELSVGQLAVKSKVHRRNVYDTLQRLLEKGMVFEILEHQEIRYQAVDPGKLKEIIQEKEQALLSIMPELEQFYRETPSGLQVYMYRGLEGWKNYMRDILRLGEDFYCIGGKGGWMDERLENFFPRFVKDAKKKKIKYFHLFDYEVKESNHPITQFVGKEYKFFPPGYSAPASMDIFGDRVTWVSEIHLGGVGKDISFVTIQNTQLADAFRTWFKFMWDFCPAVGE